jgi:hypothetical protein
MKKILWILALFPLSLGGQYTVPTYSAGYLGSPGCVNPTTTYQWIASNSCTSGAACMNDAVGGNNANQATSGNRPTYSASGTFPRPYLTFVAASDQYLTLASNISDTNTSYSFYVIVNFSGVSNNQTFIGSGGGGLAYQLSGSGKQVLAKVGTGVAATGTNAYSTSTNYALAVTYNVSANTYAFYKISGGSYASDGSGTATAETYTFALAEIGTADGSSYFMRGSSPEMGLYLGIWNSTQLTALATYVKCVDPEI